MELPKGQGAARRVNGKGRKRVGWLRGAAVDGDVKGVVEPIGDEDLLPVGLDGGVSGSKTYSRWGG